MVDEVLPWREPVPTLESWAGEIVTTGTLTRALPVAAGETWRTELKGVGLDGIEVRFS